MSELITSRQNTLVKHLVKLRTQRRYREEEGSLLLQGSTVIAEVQGLLQIRRTLALEGVKAPGPCHRVTKEVMEKVSGLPQAPDLVAEVALPPASDLRGCKRVLCLNGVRDPGNLGTLLRTALAFSWDAVFFMEQTVDPFSEKALRASKGALFQLPYAKGGLKELEALGLPVFVAQMGGTDPAPAERCALVLGGEVEGVSPEIKGNSIGISMDGPMESLNVAVAGSILMYLLAKEGK